MLRIRCEVLLGHLEKQATRIKDYAATRKGQKGAGYRTLGMANYTSYVWMDWGFRLGMEVSILVVG